MFAAPLRPAVRPLALVAAMLLGACAAADDSSSADVPAVQSPTVEVDASAAEVRLLAIGDSVLDWNGDESTPARVGVELEQRGIATVVDNRAVGGSCLEYCGGDETIPNTYVEGDWTHVLISGGGNDLGDIGDPNSRCRPIDGLMDAALDGGAMVDLIDRIPTSTTVLLYSYSTLLPWESDAICPEIRELLDRYAAFAAERPNVELVDARIVAGPDTPELWADDVHPSPEGSAAMGRFIADLIEA